jgi:phosphocarrier protein HPr
MTECEVTIRNRLGLHARAAAKFVHVASRYRAHVLVAREGRVVDGKSIMGILLLAAAHGTRITISAEGPDGQAALAALCELVDSGFGEETWNA